MSEKDYQDKSLFVPAVQSGFTNGKTEDVLTVKNTLSLQSGEKSLLFLASVYRNEKRNPTDEELILWDKWLYNRLTDNHYGWISSLETEDDELAAVWKDITEKALLQPSLSHIHPLDILSIGTYDLLRTGKIHQEKLWHAKRCLPWEYDPKETESGFYLLDKETALSIGGSRNTRPEQVPEKNDLIFWITCDSTYVALTAAQWISNKIPCIIRSPQVNGILGVLADYLLPFSLFFPAETLPANCLLHSKLLDEKNGILVIVGQENEQKAQRILEERLLKWQKIGTFIGKKNHVRIANRSYTWEPESLQKLKTLHKSAPTLKNGDTRSSLVYPTPIERNDAFYPSAAPISSTCFATVLDRWPTDEPLSYAAGQNDVLISVLKAVSSGISHDCLAMQLQLWDVPQNGPCLSESLAYQFGVYRAMQEMLIAFDETELHPSERPTAKLYAYAPNNKTDAPGLLQTASDLYRVDLSPYFKYPIRYDEWRDLIAKLEFCKEKNLFLRTVFEYNQSLQTLLPADAVIQWENDRQFDDCHSRPELIIQVAPGAPVPGFEADKMAVVRSVSEPVCDTVLRLSQNSRRFYSHPHVLFIQMPESFSADHLMQTCEHAGCTCEAITVSTFSRDEINRLSEAIPASQLIVWRGNPQMQENPANDPRLSYAIETFTAGDGLMLFDGASLSFGISCGLLAIKDRLVKCHSTEAATVTSCLPAFSKNNYSTVILQGACYYDGMLQKSSKCRCIRTLHMNGKTYVDAVCDANERIFGFISGITDDDLAAAIAFFQ